MAPPMSEGAGSNYKPAPTHDTPDPEDDEDLTVISKASQDTDEEEVDLRHGRRSPSKAPRDVEPDDYDASDEDENKSDKQQRRARRSTFSEGYTEEEEKRVIRKFDRKLVLFIALLYMLSFLDRSSPADHLVDIGNARVAGMDQSLNLSSSQFQWLLTSFYITYIAFEWMILLYGMVPPHIYISACVLTWGIVASLQSIATSFTAILILRAFLGIAEAAFSPGVPFYLTYFYKRSELAYRVGLQISAAPLAISFASTLAWLIVKVSENGPIESWRVLFLVEGFPSIIVATVAFYLIPDSPSTARYLTTREREVASLRLSSESPPQLHSHRINLREILTTILDPKAYLTALMFFSVNVAFSSLPVFLPSVLNDMSFSPLASQGLAAPPFLAAFAFVLLIGHYSDKIPDSRALFIVAVSLLSGASYGAIALAGILHTQLGDAGTITIRYIGVYGAAMGFFSAVTLIITWTLNNQQSATGKGTGMTILNVIGQCGPLVGVRLFPKNEAPYYIPGMIACAAFMLLVALLAIALRLYLYRLNRTVQVGEYEMVGMGEDGDETMVEERPPPTERFRFML